MRVRTVRKIHRWLGIFVGVQLLFWTVSGLFFALNPIDKVRGETERAGQGHLAPDFVPASPGAAMEKLRQTQGKIDVVSVVLRPHLDRTVYEINYRKDGTERWALADAATGQLREPVGRDEAVDLAQADFTEPAGIASVERITAADPGSEYRGGPLPAYRVVFAHALGTRIYVSEDRGVVTARRNDRWRLFDFLWMFHIMDYQDRDDFNSVVLQLASALGLVTVVSGFFLAGVTSPRLRRWIEGLRRGRPR